MTFLCRLPTTAMQLHILLDIQVLHIGCWATVDTLNINQTQDLKCKLANAKNKSLLHNHLILPSSRVLHWVLDHLPRAGGWKTPFWILHIITHICSVLDHQRPLPKWTIAQLPSSRVLHIECWTTNQGQERPLWIFIRGLCLLGGTVFTSVIERSHCHHLKYAMSDF